MSGDGAASKVSNRDPVRDLGYVVGTMLVIYILFSIGGWYLFDTQLANGIARQLQRVTFLTAVYALLVLALNLHWGYAGLFNIGVAGFMAVGVYGMAILWNPSTASPPGFGLPLPIAIVGGMALSAIVGAIAALPALRLKADYLAIVTVAFSEIIRLSLLSQTFENVRLFADVGFLPVIHFGTGAGRGIDLPTNPVLSLYYQNPNDTTAGLTPLGEFVFSNADALGIVRSVVVSWTYALVMIVFVVLFYWLLVRIGNSPFGRVLKAIREDEDVAQSLGKDTRIVKIKVFMVGCALMGLAGILWEGAKGFTDPTSTTLQPLQTFYVFIALIIGGAGSNTGSVIGAALFASLLFEGPLMFNSVLSKAFDIQSAPPTFPAAIDSVVGGDLGAIVAYTLTNVSSLRFVLIGVLLVVLIQRRPDGLLGHRKETAASVNLDRRERPKEPERPATAADGGVDDE